MNGGNRTPMKILVYEASLSFLKGACNTGMLRMTVDSCITAMTSNSVVNAIVRSLECRKRVLELSTSLELTNDPKLRTALRADEERIAIFLVAIFNSKSDEEAVLRLEGDSAQYFLDVVQETLDRGFMMAQEDNRMALRMIRKLSERCDRLPSSLFIVGVNGRDEHPSFGGGFGDIYRASYGDQRVALKRMRCFIRGSDLRHIRLKFCREALVWKDLRHPHILPFLGIDRDSFPSSLCMVSPWMEHGTVTNYLKTHGYANVDKLLYEIALGLEYLHSRNIVHGDLRGANILIKEDWSACLTDFGLSMFSDATSTMSTNRGGSFYWMAPELLDPDSFGLQFVRTPATDVYAFGCVCFELYTERPPFSSLREPAALMKVLNGERPQRPSGPPAMSDVLWRHVSEFWADHPIARPSTQSIVQNMIWSIPCSRPLSDAWPANSTPITLVASPRSTPIHQPFSSSVDGIGAEIPVTPEDRPLTASVRRCRQVPPPSQVLVPGNYIERPPIPPSSADPISPNVQEMKKTSSSRKKTWGQANPSDAFNNTATATVRYEYRPSLPDELSITRGEVLHVLSEYSDGWALCKNGRGGEGVVPQACLDCGNTTQTLGAEKHDYRRPLSTPTPTMFPSLPPPKLLTILAERMELLAARLRRSRRKNLNSISELEAALDALLVETNSSDALPSSTHVPSSSGWKMARKLTIPGVKMRRKPARSSSNKAKHKIEIRHQDACVATVHLPTTTQPQPVAPPPTTSYSSYYPPGLVAPAQHSLCT